MSFLIPFSICETYCTLSINKEAYFLIVGGERIKKYQGHPPVESL
jgi:hypothetical protein